MITCSRCGEDKPVEEFSPSNRSRRKPWCRDCYRAYNAERWASRSAEQVEADKARTKAYREAHADEIRQYLNDWHAARPGQKRANRILREYGITVEQYDAMLVEQAGRCAICLTPPSGSGRNTTRLHIDHDHETGKVRGLLCSRCNTALGQLADDPERMHRMINYITKARK